MGAAISQERSHYREEPDAVDETTLNITTNDDDLKTYLKTHTPEEAIAVILQHPETDCHQRAHKIGRTYYELFNTKAFTIMDTKCQSGFIHGATEAFFHEHGTNNLKENLSTICTKQNDSFFDHQCFHGIGHGLMAFNDYDLPEALKGCDLLPQSLDSCYSGVFMENVVSAIGIDEAKQRADNNYHVSSYLSPDPLYPCNATEKKYQTMCYFFQTSRMLQLGLTQKQIAQACEGIEAVYQSYCFLSMGRDVQNLNQTNSTQTESDCRSSATLMNQLNCIHGAADNTLWDATEQPKALVFCKSLTQAEFKQVCYETVTVRGKSILDKTTFTHFCESFEKDYQRLCKT